MPGSARRPSSGPSISGSRRLAGGPAERSGGAAPSAAGPAGESSAPDSSPASRSFPAPGHSTDADAPRGDGQGPEVWLALAINARTTAERRERARRGLAANEGGERDPEFECLLLRQLFLAEFEDERYADALAIAERMIDLEELADVARQDAARACLALGELEAAIGHLRIAARVCPPSRRPFHDWTLGSLLYLTGQAEAAVAALSRAARWATTQKPLYEAQLGLALRAAGRSAPDLEGLRRALDSSPCADGYGQLVLGELGYLLGDHARATDCLQSFVARVSESRPAKAATLATELTHARDLLARLRGTT